MDSKDVPAAWQREREFSASAAESVGRSAAGHCLERLQFTLRYDCGKCESVHERLFLLAWATLCERTRCTGLFSYQDRTQWYIHRPETEEDEAQFRKLQQTDIVHYDGVRQDWLAAQYSIAGKAVDFLCLRFDYTVLDPKDPDRRMRPTDRDREREVLRQCRPVVVEIGSEIGSRERDRLLQSMGYSVARFSGPEVISDPLKCASDVDRLLSPELCHKQWHRPKLRSFSH